ncbi:MAG: acyl-ACP--UDP-N-acetylglucosamine O-acyltransferase [Gammaproteobacteria bacterium]|jgi:UDP-N-acetylglucosamine acyltransferase|nr:acyl-ACP--UDP-N-acetylglucosamine O-acyltransferase [Gammaproteobacteria bacterium]
MTANNIHKTAIIDETAILGKNVTVGAYSIIHPNVTIGDNTTISSHCIIYPNTDIGKDNNIYDHVVIGANPQSLNFDIKLNTYVKILDSNIIREYVSIHRSTKEGIPTQIFNNTMIMAYCHIGHDCLVGNNVTMTNASSLGGHVMIEDYAVLGAHTLVHQHVRIGKLSMTAAGARVTKDVIPFMLLGRDPVKHYCLNKVGIKRYGIDDKNYSVLSLTFRHLKKGGDLKTLESNTEDLQYLLSWFSVKSERGYHSFI